MCQLYHIREKTKQETVQGRLTATLRERDEEIQTLKLVSTHTPLPT